MPGTRPRQSKVIAGEILELVLDRKLLLIVSDAVLREYRNILQDQEILSRVGGLTGGDAMRLVYFAEKHRVARRKFDLPRDRLDAKFVELAISSRASHIITNDRDLLSLRGGHDDASKRWRKLRGQTQIVDPLEFIRLFRAATN